MSRASEDINLQEVFNEVKEWISYLLTKWKLILIIGLVGGFSGYIYAYYQKFIYTAELSFVLEEEKGSGAGFSSIASQFGLDMGSGGGAFSEPNLMQLIKTQNIVEKSLKSTVYLNGSKITLADFYIDSVYDRKNVEINPSLKGFHFYPSVKFDSLSREQRGFLNTLYGQIVSNLTISQKDKKNSIIYIQFKCVNELFAKIFTETLAKEVSNFYIDTKSKKAKINLDILQKQADSVRGELNSSISGVAVANDNVFNLNSALMNTKRIPSVKRQIDIQANTAILTQLIANVEMAKVSLRKETPLIQVIDTPTLPLPVKKTGRTKSFLLFGFCSGLFIVVLLVGYKKVKMILSE